MKTAGRFVVVGWLLLALVLLGMDGQLPVFLAWTAPATLLVLAVGALVRQQRAPSMLDRPQLPEPYRVADDLRQPLCAVVAAAEAEATADGCSRIVGQEPGRQSSSDVDLPQAGWRSSCTAVLVFLEPRGSLRERLLQLACWSACPGARSGAIPELVDMGVGAVIKLATRRRISGLVMRGGRPCARRSSTTSRSRSVTTLPAP
jgi:hypothetical protein